MKFLCKTFTSVLFSLLLVLLSGFVQAQSVARYYISPHGNDQHSGTQNRPFKSVEAALKIAKGQAEIILKEGTYYLDHPIWLTPENVKTEFLTIKAENEGKAILSAGKRLQLQWKKGENGIYSAKVPAGISFEQLFVNGELQHMARYPNFKENEVLNGTAADAISPERVGRWKNPEGGYVHGLQVTRWGSTHFRIKGKNAADQLELKGGWQSNRPYDLHPDYRYVENIYEELDHPKEWYFNQKEGKLYLIPAPGMDLKTAKIEVSGSRESLIIQGTSENPLKNIRISGLQFQHNERSFMETQEPFLRSDWRLYRGGAVVITHTENVRVEDCTLTHLGGNAIVLNGYNKNSRISGNHIYKIGASGILFLGNLDAVKSPILTYSGFIPYHELDLTPGAASENYPRDGSADNNLIYETGKIEKQTSGIDIDIASRIRIDHNTIYDLPRAGINIGEGNFGGHILEYNDVFHTVLETGDNGAYNSWGRDRFWNANREYMDSLMFAHPDLYLLDVVEPITLRFNRFQCDHGWDIDLDDGSSNYKIYNNIALSGGIKLREGFNRVVKNNLTLNNGIHEHVWFKNSRDTITANLLLGEHQPIRMPNEIEGIIDYNYYTTPEALANTQEKGWDTHGKVVQIDFENPEQGNYFITQGLPDDPRGEYYKNFKLKDSLGVQKSSLKAIASKPDFPKLKLSSMQVGEESREFLGVTFKNIEGANEQSAYGLADRNGVIVMSLAAESPFFKSGFKIGDVILSIGNTTIQTNKDLEEAYRLVKDQKQIKIVFVRDQGVLEQLMKN